MSQAIERVPEAASPHTYVQQIAWAYWTFALANPSYFAVLFGGVIPRFQPSASSKQTMTMALETVVRILQVYMTQELLPVEDPVTLMRVLWAAFHWGGESLSAGPFLVL